MRFGFGLDLRARTHESAVIASLYGTGLGQVPLHLDPANAVMSGADVVSIANSGGAGAAFNATASATGITRTGGLLNFPNTNVHLLSANTLDMVGVRMFVVAALDPAATGSLGLTGRNVAAADGERAGLRYLTTTNALSLQRWSGALGAYDFVNFPANTPLGSSLHLLEVQIAGGNASASMDGALIGTATCAWPNFLVNRIFGGNFNPGFFGSGGDALSLIVDGSGNQSAQIATIRSALAAKYGLTLA